MAKTKSMQRRGAIALPTKWAEGQQGKAEPSRPHNSSMGRGELYEYFKRIGRLDMYFALYPAG
jgi:hypothetical protein